MTSPPPTHVEERKSRVSDVTRMSSIARVRPLESNSPTNGTVVIGASSLGMTTDGDEHEHQRARAARGRTGTRGDGRSASRLSLSRARGRSGPADREPEVAADLGDDRRLGAAVETARSASIASVTRLRPSANRYR